MNTTTVVNILNTSVSVTITNRASSIETFISSLTNSSQRLTIGLDCEWSYVGNAKVATLQLCNNTKCIIIQMCHLDYIPQSLMNFMANPNFTFVGVGINSDVERLKNDYGVGCSNYAELGQLAARRYTNVAENSSLLELARSILGAIGKYDYASRSVWGGRVLNMDQVLYAATDAYVGYLLGARLTE